uniref:hypothetical protein n=1 Tax=Nocardia farcinica TaxID=37329 RepID=UPI002455BC98
YAGLGDVIRDLEKAHAAGEIEVTNEQGFADWVGVIPADSHGRGRVWDSPAAHGLSRPVQSAGARSSAKTFRQPGAQK